MFSIYERIQNGEFDCPEPRPSKKLCEEYDRNFREDMNHYYREVRRYREAFASIILEDVGLENHPNSDKIFEYVWEQGHSGGLYEVYMTLCDIAELFFIGNKMLDCNLMDKPVGN
jgi:hypothetical protein